MKETIIIGILTSFVASVIFAVLNPQFKKLGQYIVKSFSRINIEYKNGIYKDAAKRDMSVIPLFSLFILLLFLVFFGTGYSIWIISESNNAVAKSKNMLTELDDQLIQLKETEDMLAKPDSIIKRSSNTQVEEVEDKSVKRKSILKEVEQATKSIYSLRKEVTDLHQQSKTFKITSVIVIFLIIILLLNAYFRYIRLQAISSLIVNFENKVHIIKTLVSDNEIDELNALWVKMKEEKDYSEIMEKIKIIETGKSAQYAIKP